MKRLALILGMIICKTLWACEGVCVGDFAYIPGHYYFSYITGLKHDGTAILLNSNTGSTQVSKDYALMKGCINDLSFCVGDQVRVPGHQYTSMVVGVFPNGDVYVKNINAGSAYRKKPNDIFMESKKGGTRVCFFKVCLPSGPRHKNVCFSEDIMGRMLLFDQATFPPTSDEDDRINNSHLAPDNMLAVNTHHHNLSARQEVGSIGR